MSAPHPQPSPAYLILQVLNSAFRDELDLSIEALTYAQEIVGRADIPILSPVPEVEADTEELDLTWRKDGKTLKLITYGSQSPRLYYQVDAEDPFTRGHLIPGNSDNLSEKLNWLVG